MPRVDLLGPKITLPEDWHGISAVFVAPRAKATSTVPSEAGTVGFQDTVAVSIEPVPSGTTPRAYLDAQIEAMRASGQTVELIETQPTEGSVASITCELTATGPRGRQIGQVQFVAIKNGMAWIVLGNAPRDHGWAEAKERLQKIIETFEF